MGCDIHTFFETRQPDGSWKLTFGSRPSEWWDEEFIEEKIENGSAITAFGPPTDDDRAAYREHRIKLGYRKDPDDFDDEDVLRYKVEQHYKSLSPEEIEEQFGSHPRYTRNFLPKELNDIDGRWSSINTRSYYWFAAVCRESVEHRFRGDEGDLFNRIAGFSERGDPGDLSPEGQHEFRRYEGDAHSHSWLMVREILDEPKCKGTHDPDLNRFDPYPHYAWLEKNIPDPDNTRMVFYFDN